jgi:hypothetical protein
LNSFHFAVVKQRRRFFIPSGPIVDKCADWVRATKSAFSPADRCADAAVRCRWRQLKVRLRPILRFTSADRGHEQLSAVSTRSRSRHSVCRVRPGQERPRARRQSHADRTRPHLQRYAENSAAAGSVTVSPGGPPGLGPRRGLLCAGTNIEPGSTRSGYTSRDLPTKTVNSAPLSSSATPSWVR